MKQRDGDVQRRLISMEPVSILGHDIYLHMTYIGATDTMSYHDLSTLNFHSTDTRFSCIRVRENVRLCVIWHLCVWGPRKLYHLAQML